MSEVITPTDSTELQFNCSSCHTLIAVDNSDGGGTVQCPNCKNIVMIPLPGIERGLELGEFVIIKKLGVGGMGEVWLAKQTSMDRNVALKILSPTLTKDQDFVNRFSSEVKLSAKLTHQNIVSAYSAGVDKGIRYLAMTFVDGIELEEKLNGVEFLGEKISLPIIRSLAEALKYAWEEHQILHRDIKPANIMITDRGVPMLMDMGISKSLSENTSLTMTGVVIGSPHYMSPEQAKAQDDLDFRADLYSLGATLYHMVAGSVPYDATTAMGILAKHMTEPFPNPQERNVGLSEECAVLLEIMLAKDKTNRQSSWDDLIIDIDLVLNEQFPRTKRPNFGDSVVIQGTKSQLLSRRKIQKRSQKAHLPSYTPAGTVIRPQQQKSSTSLILGIVAIFALLIGGGFLYMQKLNSDKEERLERQRIAKVAEAKRIITENRLAQEAKTQSVKLAEEKRIEEETVAKLAKIKTVYDYAVSYAKENPKEYVIAIQNFERVKSLNPDTIMSMKIETEITKIKKLLQSDKQASELAKRMAEEEKLAKLAEEKRLAKEKEDTLKRELQQQKEQDILFAKLAKDILNEDYTKALDSLGPPRSRLATSNSLGTPRSRLATSNLAMSSATNILKDLVNLDQSILNGFKNNIGKTIPLFINRKKTTALIKSVENNKIKIQYNVGKMILGKDLKIADLAISINLRISQGKRLKVKQFIKEF